MSWIAGLDIIYSLQDKDFDEKAGLHSIPVRVGVQRAIHISGICYVCSFAAMAIGRIDRRNEISLLDCNIARGCYIFISPAAGKIGQAWRKIFKAFQDQYAYFSPAFGGYCRIHNNVTGVLI